jgi:hypothetical protein
VPRISGCACTITTIGGVEGMTWDCKTWPGGAIESGWPAAALLANKAATRIGKNERCIGVLENCRLRILRITA